MRTAGWGASRATARQGPGCAADGPGSSEKLAMANFHVNVRPGGSRDGSTVACHLRRRRRVDGALSGYPLSNGLKTATDSLTCEVRSGEIELSVRGKGIGLSAMTPI